MCELSLRCRSIGIVSDVVRKAHDEHVGFGNAVVVEEDIGDVAAGQIVDPLFESTRLLGDGIGGDSFNGGRDATTDVAHEESFSGNWNI